MPLLLLNCAVKVTRESPSLRETVQKWKHGGRCVIKKPPKRTWSMLAPRCVSMVANVALLLLFFIFFFIQALLFSRHTGNRLAGEQEKESRTCRRPSHATNDLLTFGSLGVKYSGEIQQKMFPPLGRIFSFACSPIQLQPNTNHREWISSVNTLSPLCVEVYK